MEKTNKGLLIPSIVTFVIICLGFIFYSVYITNIFIGVSDTPTENIENLGLALVWIVSLIVAGVMLVPQIINIVLTSILAKNKSKYGKISLILTIAFIVIEVITLVLSMVLIQANNA